MTQAPIRVAVTGAAGQIGYALLFRIASGQMFGPDQPVVLQLIEIPAEKPMAALSGVAMELEDCAFPLLSDMVLTSDPAEGFRDANWALLVGSKPRGPGMERNDLIKENGPIFTGQGRAINDHAAPDVRVAVVGNPCNTNCLIAMHSAPDLPRERFTAMTRLDQNRAQAQLAARAGVATTAVENTLIWGNHSATQVPDFHNATIDGRRADEVIADPAWLEGPFFETVQKRGAAIIQARGLSSAASAANALVGPRARPGLVHARGPVALGVRAQRRLLRRAGGPDLVLPRALGRRRRLVDRPGPGTDRLPVPAAGGHGPGTRAREGRGGRPPGLTQPEHRGAWNAPRNGPNMPLRQPEPLRARQPAFDDPMPIPGPRPQPPTTP